METQQPQHSGGSERGAATRVQPNLQSIFHVRTPRRISSRTLVPIITVRWSRRDRTAATRRLTAARPSAKIKPINRRFPAPKKREAALVNRLRRVRVRHMEAGVIQTATRRERKDEKTINEQQQRTTTHTPTKYQLKSACNGCDVWRYITCDPAALGSITTLAKTQAQKTKRQTHTHQINICKYIPQQQSQALNSGARVPNEVAFF